MGRVTRTVCIGVDLGQANDSTAYAVTEQVKDGEALNRRFVCHAIARLGIGIPYPSQACRLAQVFRNAAVLLGQELERDDYQQDGYLRAREHPDLWAHRAAASVYVLMDATGVGRAVCDALREPAGIPAGQLCAVTITAGTGCEVSRGARNGRVSKEHLKSRLQAVLGFGRLKLPNTEEARVAADELEDFELTISESGTARYGARSGAHDDLVIALALSVLLDDAAYECGSLSYI